MNVQGIIAVLVACIAVSGVAAQDQLTTPRLSERAQVTSIPEKSKLLLVLPLICSNLALDSTLDLLNMLLRMI